MREKTARCQLKWRARKYDKRAKQTYEFLTGSVGEIAACKLEQKYNDLGGLTMKEYQEQVGPAQYFITFGRSDEERWVWKHASSSHKGTTLFRHHEESSQP